jgi:hypothetical protein
LLILTDVVCGWANGQESKAPTPNETSYYFIAIHNEPYHFPGGRRALEASYRTLVEMVEQADKYDIKLTLMFAPQWADSQRVMEKLGFRYERNFEFAGLGHRSYRLISGDWIRGGRVRGHL